MGLCKICGEQAGFLRGSHKECRIKDEEKRQKREDAKQTIILEIESAGTKNSNLQSLTKKVTELADSNKLDQNEIDRLIVKGWEQAVDRAFDDDILSEEEQSNLTNLMEHFSLSQNQIDQNGAYTKIIKGEILRDVMEGNVPERLKIEGNLPFNFQKNEKLIWVFQNVDYLEQKKRTQYVGGSRGVSVRVAKGLYLRAGAFKGERVESHETIHADTGLLGVTNKHLYFSGSSKSFRIKHDKIVSFEPFSDGIGVQRDAMTAKPQTFVTNDGWFTYNLITNVAQL